MSISNDEKRKKKQKNKIILNAVWYKSGNYFASKQIVWQERSEVMIVLDFFGSFFHQGKNEHKHELSVKIASLPSVMAKEEIAPLMLTMMLSYKFLKKYDKMSY